MRGEKVIERGNWEVSIKKMNLLDDGFKVLKFLGREDKIPALRDIVAKVEKRELLYEYSVPIYSRRGRGRTSGKLVDVNKYVGKRPYYQAPIETVRHINVICNWVVKKIDEINRTRC